MNAISEKSNYPINYNSTHSLLTKKPLSNNSLAAGFEKVGYLASAVFVGIYETFRNLAYPLVFLNQAIYEKFAAEAFDIVDYFAVLDELLGSDSPASFHTFVKTIQSPTGATTDIKILKEDQIALREAMAKKGIKTEDVMATLRSKKRTKTS